MGLAITLPTPGGSLDTWGTILNTAINSLNAADQFKRKTVLEPITSNTVVQDDDELFVPVLSNGIYKVDWSFRVDGATAGDFKYAFTGPAGAIMTWDSLGHDAADTTNVAPRQIDVAAIGTTIIHGTLGAGVISRVKGSGLLTVSSTAGDLKLQWAQGTSSATATNMNVGSWLLARQVG